MAVYEGVPTPATYAGMVLNNWIQKKRARRVSIGSERANNGARFVNSLMRIVLHIVGFSALTNAMFQWNMIAGWIAVAVSCFVFSWLFTTNGEQPDSDSGQMRR
jgi:hypothetical protein